MGERKLIQHRCLAVQLVKKEPPVTSPASSDNSSGDTATPVNDPATATQAPVHQDGLHLFRVRQLLYGGSYLYLQYFSTVGYGRLIKKKNLFSTKDMLEEFAD